MPLRDTFLLDDAKLKRKFFTDAIKQNVVERQSILNEAVHDSDREIAYYAVSLMTAHMEQLNEEIYTIEEKIKRGAEDDACWTSTSRRYASSSCASTATR